MGLQLGDMYEKTIYVGSCNKLRSDLCTVCTAVY